MGSSAGTTGVIFCRGADSTWTADTFNDLALFKIAGLELLIAFFVESEFSADFVVIALDTTCSCVLIVADPTEDLRVVFAGDLDSWKGLLNLLSKSFPVERLSLLSKILVFSGLVSDLFTGDVSVFPFSSVSVALVGVC
jgi:hypothetical protein